MLEHRGESVMEQDNALEHAVDLRSEEESERVRDSGRYALVGRCVSSITHDVNNYLGAIMAYTELVSLEESLPAESRRMLDEVLNAVRKASDLVGTLTDVARPARSDIRMMSPAKLAERVLAILRYDLKVARVVVHSETAPGLAAMPIDVPRLQIALMALALNAIESTAGAKERTLIFNVGAEDQTVLFRISSNGPAIPAAHRPQMFDPFWTTKEPPHLGLGLALAQKAAELHNGTLDYDPEQGFLLRIDKAGIK